MPTFRSFCQVTIVFALAGCAADSLVLPSEGAPSRVAVIAGSGQEGEAGLALSESLVVKITDGDDRPVVNQQVGFGITGDGRVVPAVVLTDGEGMARFSWVLGTSAGSQTLEVGVTSGNSLSPKTNIDAMAQPGPVHAMALIGGDSQTGQAGGALRDSLVVRLADKYGNPVPGELVTWEASAGVLAPPSTRTNGSGESSVHWTLGSGVGNQIVTASYPGASGSPVIFTATATPGASPRLVIVTQPSSSAQSGLRFAQQPAVRLESAQGTPLSTSGIAVSVAISTGGGSLSGTTTVLTDGNGFSQFTDLAISGSSGTRTLIFAAAGHTAAISDPISVTLNSPSSSQSTLTASPQTVALGESSIITVTARDASGNPIAGLSVSISVSGSGNSINQPSSTNASGVAVGSFSGSTTGSRTISATAGGVAINQTATVTVTASGPVASKSYAIVPGGQRFSFTTITIVSQDVQGNPLTRGGYASHFQVSVTGNNTSSPNVVDNNDGTYSASYFTLFKGTDQVAITFDGIPIQGSPYKSKVK
ncbi:MAG: invasin domain 3-containing protein [Gemmatimonadota bacterium]